MATYLGIGLISAAMILLQLALLRLFAVQQFYHFAFMAVSLALLGNGASGSLLSVWRRRPAPAWLCLGFGLSTLAAYFTINYLPFDSFSIAWDRRQVLYLAVYFLAAALPFLFAGLLVGGALMAAGGEGGGGSHRVYAANLIGSALGSAGSLAGLAAFGGEGAVTLAALLAVGAGLLFVLAQGGSWRAAGLLLAAAAAGLFLLLRPPAWMAQQLSPYKTLSILSQALDARHTYTGWDATARVDVVESSAIHIMPGLSLASPEGPPLQAGLMVDGDSLMPISALAADAPAAAILADYLPHGVAYRLRPGARTLVIEAGAGMDVLMALAAGASQVTAVEDTALIVRTVQEVYNEFTAGLYSDPRVTVLAQSGRVYARQPGAGPYQVAIVALTDPHRPVTSGAYSLTENYVYTVEAFADYLGVLEEDGLLAASRWLQTPPSESGRLIGAVAAALAASDRDPAAHLIAFRSLRTVTVLASPRPFSAAEIATVREFLQQRGFDAIYYPGVQPGAEDLNRYNVLPEPVYSDLAFDILRQPARTYADYRFDIRPPTDNRPFFFHFFKWRQTPEILALLGVTWQPFGGSGFFVLVALLILVGLAAAVLILGPLLWQRLRQRPGPAASLPAASRYLRLRVFTYFAGLGLAFLFVEIPLAQRFILALGQPVTALAVVIFSILLFSGLGSLTVRRWRLRWGLGLLVAAIAVYPLLLQPVTALALRWPGWAAILLAAAAMAPLGYLMGLPFAGGLRIVERLDPGLVPWAWAINGSFSVISTVLAVMVALSWGFAAVLWLGAAAYALAWLALPRQAPA